MRFLKAVTIGAMLILNMMLQTLLFPKLDAAGVGVYPDTLLILCVCFGALGGDLTGVWAGLFGGLMLDVLFATTIGYNALVYTLLGFAAGTMKERFNTQAFWAGPLMAFAGYLAMQMLNMISIYFIMRLGFDFWYNLGRYILPGALMTGVVAIPVHLLLRLLFKTRLMQKRKPRPSIERRLSPLE